MSLNETQTPTKTEREKQYKVVSGGRELSPQSEMPDVQPVSVPVMLLMIAFYISPLVLAIILFGMLK